MTFTPGQYYERQDLYVEGAWLGCYYRDRDYWIAMVPNGPMPRLSHYNDQERAREHVIENARRIARAIA